MARKNNKAQRVINRLIEESYYTKERHAEDLRTDVYWKVCTHLGNPDRWPQEYSDAFAVAFKD